MLSAVCCKMRGDDRRLVQSIGQVTELSLNRRTHEVVAVVDDQRNLRMILLVHAARKLRRDNHRALQLAVAHIFALPACHCRKGSA